jgi:hypothetical protein
MSLTLPFVVSWMLVVGGVLFVSATTEFNAGETEQGSSNSLSGVEDFPSHEYHERGERR